MNTVLTLVVLVGMITFCLFAMWVLVREMRVLDEHETASRNLRRRQVEFERLIEDDRARAAFWAEADEMIDGARR